MIIGNLTKDPRLDNTKSKGTPVCNFDVAVNLNRKNEEGKQLVAFYRVTAWNRQAEICARYLTKGEKVAVVGEPSAEAWKRDDGTIGVQLKIDAREVEFLSSGKTETATTEHVAEQGAAAQFTPVDDELPF